MASQMDDREKMSKGSGQEEEDLALLKIHVRSDLYRAFRRCVWMTVYETGMSIVDVHNKMIEDLLRNKGC